MAKHTPGPWVFDREHGTVKDQATFYTIANIVGRPRKLGAFDLTEALANARLIAAAPEMLAKLEEIYEWLDGIGDGAPDAGTTARRALNEAGTIADVIRKARGER